MVESPIDSPMSPLEEIPELPNKDIILDSSNHKPVLEKLVSCGFCNRTFYESRLEGHRRICTKEKPFKPLAKKLNKNSSCVFALKNTEESPQHTPEIHEKKEEIIERVPIYDEKEAFKEQILVRCEQCDRKFDMQRIEKHKGVCKGKKPNEGFLGEIKKIVDVGSRKSIVLDNEQSEKAPLEKPERRSVNIERDKKHQKPTHSTVPEKKGFQEGNSKQERKSERPEKTEKKQSEPENHSALLERHKHPEESPSKRDHPEGKPKESLAQEKKNPLLLMKNYTKKLVEQKKNSEAQEKRPATPQKLVSSPKKASNSPVKKNPELEWGSLTEESFLVVKNHGEDILEKSIERGLKNSGIGKLVLEKTFERGLNNSGVGTPLNATMKICDFCGKMFPESL